jgi:prepilin-type processing-associated H-X9-DG protein
MKKLGCLLVVLILVVCFVINFDVTRALVFGWALFLVDVLPRVTVNAASLIVAAIAILLFTGGVHVAGRRWRRAPPGPEQGNQAPWKLRWSLTMVAAVFLAFAAGICLVGITHQTVWLISADEPFFGEALKRDWSGQKSRDKLKAIGIGAHDYQTNLGELPAAGTFTPRGEMLHSWETQLLPFLWYASEIDPKLPWNHPANARFFQGVVPEFINPELGPGELVDADGFGLSHYAANSRVLAVNKRVTVKDLGGGASYTPLFGEVNANFKPWGYPVNWRDPARGVNRSPYGFGGPPSAGGANFAMADGSVRFVSERVDPEVLKALSTPGRTEGIGDEVLEPAR